MILRDPITQASRGFGFVTFDTEECAQKLIKKTKQVIIKGRKADIKKAEPKMAQREGTAQPKSGMGFSGG